MMRNSKIVEMGRKKFHGNLINRADGPVAYEHKEERFFWDHTHISGIMALCHLLMWWGKKL